MTFNDLRNITVTLWPKGSPELPSSRFRVYNLEKYFRDTGGFTFHIAPHKITDFQSLFLLIRLLLKSDIFVCQKRYIGIKHFILMKIFRVRILFDFDDALFARRSWSSSRHAVNKHNQKKLNLTLSLADYIIVSNEFLKLYVLDHNKHVSIIPTMVPELSETTSYITDEKIIIGWIGTKENFIYLKLMENTLKLINKRYRNKIIFKIISNGIYRSTGSISGLVNIPWSPEIELSELLTFNIGVMPLLKDDWSKGKNMFKALQMMSIGIPVVVSKTGVNTKLISDGENGFLAENTSDWVKKLSQLIDSEGLRKTIGLKGQEFVKLNFNPSKHAEKLCGIIRNHLKT